jgi:hypothetical protein
VRELRRVVDARRLARAGGGRRREVDVPARDGGDGHDAPSCGEEVRQAGGDQRDGAEVVGLVRGGPGGGRVGYGEGGYVGDDDDEARFLARRSA